MNEDHGLLTMPFVLGWWSEVDMVMGDGGKLDGIPEWKIGWGLKRALGITFRERRKRANTKKSHKV